MSYSKNEIKKSDFRLIREKGGKYADAAYGQGSQYRLEVFAKGAFLLKLHFL